MNEETAKVLPGSLLVRNERSLRNEKGEHMLSTIVGVWQHDRAKVACVDDIECSMVMFVDGTIFSIVTSVGIVDVLSPRPIYRWFDIFHPEEGA